MLSRRFLRIKVLQALYAFQQQGSENFTAAEKQLLTSLYKLYDLYIYLLSFICELSDFASKRIEENRLKMLPTYEDLHPNLRYVNNALVNQISNNLQYLRKREALKINWIDEEDLVRKIYNIIRTDEAYISYMEADTTYENDKRFVRQVVLKHISESELLRSVLEEKNIYWSEDFDIGLMMADKTIKQYKASMDASSHLPSLLKDENDIDGSEDLKFLKILFQKTVFKSDEYEKLVEERAIHWEVDRIAKMDVLLIKMAITELVEFPSIPIKVTLNEYIELTKEYSSPKSKIFVNGILDKIIEDFNRKGIIKKSGRGLLEQ